MTNASNPRKWQSTINPICIKLYSSNSIPTGVGLREPTSKADRVKTAVFGASFSLPPLVDRGGGLGLPAELKASLFLEHFDAKQRRDSFQQPHSCDPSPVLYSVVFRSSFIRRLLLDPDPYGGNNPDSMFLLFTSW